MNIKLRNGQVSKNFNVQSDRIACRHCGIYVLDEKVTRHNLMRQELREWLNEAMIVTSGQRCKTHNIAIGGSKTSRHIDGIADDIAVRNALYTYTKARRDEYFKNIRAKWFEICDKYGVAGGFGRYDNAWRLNSRAAIFHLDSRESTRSSWLEVSKHKYERWEI